MNINTSSSDYSTAPLRAIWRPVRQEWPWWLPVAISTFFLASLLMSGWPNGLIPNVSYPYTYQGDGLSHSWMTQRILEGWIFDNPRSGYPFGSDFRDYPGADSGNLFLLKLIGLFSTNYTVALNLFFLLSFPVVFIASFAVLRAIHLSPALAICSSILFSFLPFHFYRLAHIFYVWYFVVPLFFYVGFVIFEGVKTDFQQSNKWAYGFLLLLLFSALASFGVYYAVFGIIVLGSAGLLGQIKRKNSNSLLFSISTIAMVVFGILINIAPNIVSNIVNGKNTEVAVRSTGESEIYGLKLIQLILPTENHRIDLFSKINNNYKKNHPLVNENHKASLGLIGALGFLGLGAFILMGLAGKRINDRLALIAAIVLVLFIFGTIGGLGAVFSEFISSSIRGWNRISIFIAFGSIAAFFISLEIIAYNFISTKMHKVLFLGSAILLVIVGLYDQTTPVCISCNTNNKIAYEADRKFIQDIEAMVPAHSAIYQLPYMPFPESSHIFDMASYDHVKGFLHSKNLRWSFAGMKGRQGDMFYRLLAQEPIQKQIEVLQRLGFAGIYIDRGGYKDRAVKLIKNLTNLLGQEPSLWRADKKIVFFNLQPSFQVDLSDLDATQIMHKAGYFTHTLESKKSMTIADGIDFTRPNWPAFIDNIDGLSALEHWGRWSDANIAPQVQISFIKPLPQKFVLVLKAQAFGPNVDNNITIRISSRHYNIALPAEVFEVRVPVDLKGDTARQIDFVPPAPISPAELDMNPDSRKLGLGFIQLKIEAQQQ